MPPPPIHPLIVMVFTLKLKILILTSFEMLNSTLSCLAISGLIFDQQPVFQWSTSGFSPVPLGHPDKWDFPLVNVTWN